MVPDGLVLLTSLAFMAGVVKLARRNALLKELASVEMLARVDTLCLDKTGTITTGQIVMAGIDLLPPPSPGFLTTSHDNGGTPSKVGGDVMSAGRWPRRTIQRHPGGHRPRPPRRPGLALVDSVPLSAASGRPPSLTVGDLPGRPEILAPATTRWPPVQDQAVHGRRVVLVATAPGHVTFPRPVPRAHPLEDDVASTPATRLPTCRARHRLKVISGTTVTVGAVAPAGAPDAGRSDACDGPSTTTMPWPRVAQYRALAGSHQKRARALQSRGHVVGMTGDGVNDVLALKDADMGIAMGAGSAASRAVAQLVLLENRFSVLPGVLAEGRRVINSVERAANLFIYGTVYSACMAVVIAVVGTDYPFLPRHLTLVRSLSVGIPGFFLALAPDPRRARTGFVARVVRFACRPIIAAPPPCRSLTPAGGRRRSPTPAHRHGHAARVVAAAAPTRPAAVEVDPSLRSRRYRWRFRSRRSSTRTTAAIAWKMASPWSSPRGDPVRPSP